MHGSVALMTVAGVARMMLMVMVVRLCLGLSLGMLDAGQSGQLLQRNRTEAYGRIQFREEKRLNWLFAFYGQALKFTLRRDVGGNY